MSDTTQEEVADVAEAKSPSSHIVEARRGSRIPTWVEESQFAVASLSPHVMGVAPLFPVAAGMIAGIGLDRMANCGALIYLAGFLASGLTLGVPLLRRTTGAFLVFLASVFVGGSLHMTADRTVPASSIARYVEQPRRLMRVRGVVASEPRLRPPPKNPFAAWTYGKRRTVFLLNARSVPRAPVNATTTTHDVSVTGRVYVSVAEPLLDLRQNEFVELFGWLYPLRSPRNPGSFDWSARARREGIVGILNCRQRENVRRLDDDPPRGTDLITRFRTRMRGMLTDDLVTGAPEEASLLEAMILGHRSRLDRRLNEAFIQAGCAHFLAVSGVHVVIVMFFLRMGSRLLTLGPRFSTLVLLLGVVTYAFLAEPRPPILRATVIAVIYCIARLLGREKSCLNWMSATAILFVLVEPRVIFDVGFQLSFAAVLGVSYLSPVLLECAASRRRTLQRCMFRCAQPLEEERLKRLETPTESRMPHWMHALWRFVRRYIRLGLAVAFGAWLAGVPIVAWHFNRVQPWGAISSLVALPVVSLVMLLGFAKLLLSAFVPDLASVVSVPLTTADAALLWLVEQAGSLPGASVILAAPPWWLLVAYYSLLVTFALSFPRDVLLSWGPTPLRGHLRTPHPPMPRKVCGAAFVAVGLFAITWAWPAAPGRLTVHVLSVGAGSATVIELPEGQTLLYDAGSTSPNDVGRHTIVPFLRHRGIHGIDRVHLSHPNLDHFSGLPSVLEAIDAGPILVNPYFLARSPPRSPARHLLDMLAGRKHPIEVLDPNVRRWERGGVDFELLWPPPRLDGAVATNDTSTVLRLSYAGRSIMLTGDVEDYAQAELVRRVCGEDVAPSAGQRGGGCPGLHADVLVLPHHGSVRASSEAFINAVGADVFLRSSHERLEETFTGLHNLTAPGVLLNTADVGAIQVSLDEHGIHIATGPELDRP